MTLRQKLDETGEEDLRDQVESIEHARRRYGNAISLVRETLDTDRRKYNCFMFALGFEDSDVIMELLATNRRKMFGSDFVQRLISVGKLSKSDSGDIVVYFDDANRPLHAGRLETGEIVISKWGVGHLWRHGLLEIPTGYGNYYKFFRSATPTEIISEYRLFARRVT